MSNYTCGICLVELDIHPKMPLELKFDHRTGKPCVVMDLEAAYVHIQIAHPGIWDEKIAKEYENWKAGNL